MNEKPTIDRKDLDILMILDRYGAKATASFISQVTNIPKRTVRHRIRRLRNLSLLLQPHILTYERKIGLGENILLLELNEEKRKFRSEIFDSIPSIYWYSSTYGRYTGFIVHSVFPLEYPDLNRELISLLTSENLVKDSYLFDIVDYEVKGWDFSYLSSDFTWTWNWDQWLSKIAKTLTEKTFHSFDVKKIKKIRFDYNDVLLIKALNIDATLTLNKLAETVNLSITQTRRKLRRLERLGIIRGYKSVFDPKENRVPVLCIIESKKYISPIVSCFKEIPFPIDIFIQTKNKVGIALGLRDIDFPGFLKGLDLVRSYTSLCFMQISHNPVRLPIRKIYDLYNKEKGVWEVPTSNFHSILKK